MFDPIKPPEARRPEETLELVAQALSDGDLEAALAQYESPALLASWPGRTLHADFDVRGILESFMALRLPLAVRIVTVLETPDLALVICERRVAGMSPDDEPIRLCGQGCAVVRLHRDGSWRIAADTWQAAAEPPAECWLSSLPDPGTTVRSELLISSYNSAVTNEAGAAFELGTDGPMVILVGVDGSVTSMRAGAYATGLARRQGARLVMVYVEQYPAMYGAAASAGAGAIAEQEKALAETAADLKRQAEEGAARLGVRLEFVTAYGDPYHELRRVADKVRADAVVVGASAKAGHRWVGSLAVRLVKAGRWPVTVVP